MTLMPEEECIITWSYEVSFAKLSWLYKATCKDMCTNTTINYTTNEKKDAIKTCIENLYKALPNETHNTQAQNCLKCVGETTVEKNYIAHRLN